MKHATALLIVIWITTTIAPAHESLQGPTETIQWDQARAYNGYTLFSARGTSYLIDMEGQVINTWPIGTTPQFLDNGNLLDASKDDPSGFGGFRELDWDGNVVWSYDERREGYSPHHDWVRIYNKALGEPTMLYIANRIITHQEAIAAGCDPANGPYDGAQLDSIVEIDMDGNIIWEWRFFDHTVQDVDPTKPNYVGQGKTVADYPHRINLNIPGRPVKRDWLHCNSLDYNPELGHIVTNSVQGEFYVIDHDGTFVAGDPEESVRLAAGPKGDFLYRFGDPARYAQGDPPSILPDWTQSTTGNKQIGGAHDVQWIDEGLPGAGNFLIFNNAQYLFERTPQSYILEINGMLDREGRETGDYVNPPDAGYFRWEHPNRDSQKTPRWVSNQIVWMYYSRSNQGFFSHIGSGAQRLPNGNTLICAMTEGHFFEVTPEAEVVWEYINPVTTDGVVRVLKDAFPMSNAVFRAYRYGPDHRALRGRDLKPMGLLTDLAEQGVIKTSPPGRGPGPGQPGMQQGGRRGPGQGGQQDQQRGQRGPGQGGQSGQQRSPRGQGDAQRDPRPSENTTTLNPEQQFQFTEGPVADAQGNVYFTDVRASRIYRRNVDGQLDVVLEDSGGANGLAIDAAGRLVLCQGELGRVARLDKDGSFTVLAEEYDGKRFNKPNDLWIAPNSGIYFSDPLYGRGTATQDGEHDAWHWGDAQFIVLDPFWPTTSKARSADGWRWTLGREQYNWLRNTLEASDAAFKFVFIHNLVGGNDESARGGAEAAAFFEWGGDDLDGRYTFGTHRPELEMPIHDLLVKKDVSIVFHGHDHFFARQERDGVVYQLVPQPGHASKQHTHAKQSGRGANSVAGNAHRMAAEYGYQTGDFLSGSGCLRIAISPEEATVDYLLSDGNKSDITVAYSYTLTPRLNDTSESTVQEDAREIAPAPTAEESVDRRPNFVLLLSDDQDWTGLSVAMHDEVGNSKSDFYQTPNLEKLAAQGMRFTDAYAPSPVCSPTRYSLQTGKSPAALHWTKASPTVTAADGYKFIAPTLVRQIDSNETTIGEMLGAAGYATAHYGKWHLSGGGPGMHGYDEHDGDTSNGDAAPFTDPNPVDIFGMGKRAADFMAKSTREGKPFFIQMSYHALHYPENASTANKGKYGNMPPGRMHHDPLRAAITEDLDSGVGLLLEEIDKLGIAANTFVIYMSDNGGGGGGGGGKGKGGARPIQGGKGSLWEGGVRVPLIIRGPGIRSNTFCHVPVVGYDFLPTFCELAGVTEPLPDDIEGGSIVDLLRNGDAGKVQRPREEIVFHFPHYQSGDGPHSTIRLGDEKLIRLDETGQIRLFDLSQDIGEQHDLATVRPERTKELLQRLDAYLEAIDAQHAVPNPNYDPSREPTAKPGRKGSKAGEKRGRRIRQAH